MMRVAYPCGRHTSHNSGTVPLRAAGRAQFSDQAPGFGFSQFGYPMLRSGSVVGVSASVRISSFTSSGDIRVEVRRGGSVAETTVFTATATVSGTGELSWYDVQDADVDTFNAEDVLLVYITVVSGSYTWTNAFALVEVEHDEP